MTDLIIPYVIGTGFGSTDQLIGGLGEGAMTVITGKRGEGKSTYRAPTCNQCGTILDGGRATTCRNCGAAV